MPADTSLPEGVTLVDAFPFDSNPELITDVNGYLRGDRSVDAWTMQRVFKQFFSDGVFGTPSDALQISKGTSGLTVTISPGMFVIQGGMGGVKESDGALTLTLDTGAAAGNVCYGIMLRYDNNPDMRGLGFRVVKGTAGASPQPPAPDQTSENVMEYRLGYVTVPNGATDLTNATVTNEKGTDMCPYASPFVPLDLSAITDDAKEQAHEATDAFLLYAQKYYDLVASALDGTTADELQEQIDNISPANFVDNVTLNQTSDAKMQVKDSGISTAKIQDGAVTKDKLEDYFDFIAEPSTAGRVLTGGEPPTWSTVKSLLTFESPVTLWTGKWSSGSITVSGINNYFILRVEANVGDFSDSGQIYILNINGVFRSLMGTNLYKSSSDAVAYSYPIVGFTADGSGNLTPDVTFPVSSGTTTLRTYPVAAFRTTTGGPIRLDGGSITKIEGLI